MLEAFVRIGKLLQWIDTHFTRHNSSQLFGCIQLNKPVKNDKSKKWDKTKKYWTTFPDRKKRLHWPKQDNKKSDVPFFCCLKMKVIWTNNKHNSRKEMHEKTFRAETDSRSRFLLRMENENGCLRRIILKFNSNYHHHTDFVHFPLISQTSAKHKFLQTSRYFDSFSE